jgi:hypothetical protein
MVYIVIYNWILKNCTMWPDSLKDDTSVVQSNNPWLVKLHSNSQIIRDWSKCLQTVKLSVTGQNVFKQSNYPWLVKMSSNSQTIRDWSNCIQTVKSSVTGQTICKLSNSWTVKQSNSTSVRDRSNCLRAVKLPIAQTEWSHWWWGLLCVLCVLCVEAHGSWYSQFYALYAFYVWRVHFPQSEALAKDTSRPMSHKQRWLRSQLWQFTKFVKVPVTRYSRLAGYGNAPWRLHGHGHGHGHHARTVTVTEYLFNV